jgi:uncharacterized membrane protein YkgB
MNRLGLPFDQIDRSITGFMAKYGIQMLRISLGINFLWFGLLKFVPGLSPAQELATHTIEKLTFGIVESSESIYILATWETLIGLALITGVFLRATLFLLFLQMLGTLSPLVLFPELTFVRFPYAPTMEGQYIIKNLVLISAAMVVGSTVRGGRIVAEATPVIGGEASAATG